MKRADNDDVIRRLLQKRDPTPAILVEVERMGDEGTRLLSKMLDSGELSATQQRRALQGLCSSTKHAGYEQHLLLLELALSRVESSDFALRSIAVLVAVGSIAPLRARLPSAVATNAGTAPVEELKRRVAVAVKRAVIMGVSDQARKRAEALLTETNDL